MTATQGTLRPPGSEPLTAIPSSPRRGTHSPGYCTARAAGREVRVRESAQTAPRMTLSHPRRTATLSRSRRTFCCANGRRRERQAFTSAFHARNVDASALQHAVPYVRELLLERGRDPEDAARHVESLFAPYWLGGAEDDDPEPEA